MAQTLYNENFESLDEYARRLIQVGFSKPTYKIRINYITYYPNRGVGISVLDQNGQDIPRNFPGIYAIFEGEPNKNNCLYVGGTSADVGMRLYRFVKEMLNVSRPDETHPAARKARRHGCDAHNLYVKFLNRRDFPEIRNTHFSKERDIERFIDQWVAPLMESRFNRKVKK